MVWQVLEPVLGYPWLSGAKRVVQRVASGFRALVYLSLAIGAGQLPLEPGEDVRGQQHRDAVVDNAAITVARKSCRANGSRVAIGSSKTSRLGRLASPSVSASWHYVSSVWTFDSLPVTFSPGTRTVRRVSIAMTRPRITMARRSDANVSDSQW